MKHLLSLIALPAAAGFGTLPARRIDTNPSAGVKTGLGLPVFQRASSPRMTVADATAAKAALRVALASADGEPKSPAVTAAIAELEQFCVAEPAVSPLWVGHWKVCFPRQLFETQLALICTAGPHLYYYRRSPSPTFPTPLERTRRAATCTRSAARPSICTVLCTLLRVKP